MRRVLTALLLITPTAACDRVLPGRIDMTVPTAAQADSIFQAHGIHGSVAISGNVVEVSTSQARDQLQRGGELWARVGPFIYLFSPATTELFGAYPGLAAVRARTLLGDAEVARAQLVRDTMRGGDWRQARLLLAQALREGTARPSRLEALVHFGERFTTYDYSPAWVRPDDEREAGGTP